LEGVSWLSELPFLKKENKQRFEQQKHDNDEALAKHVYFSSKTLVETNEYQVQIIPFIFHSRCFSLHS